MSLWLLILRFTELGTFLLNIRFPGLEWFLSYQVGNRSLVTFTFAGIVVETGWEFISLYSNECCQTRGLWYSAMLLLEGRLKLDFRHLICSNLSWLVCVNNAFRFLVKYPFVTNTCFQLYLKAIETVRSGRQFLLLTDNAQHVL
jgi:hypothetical protein